MLVAFLLSPVQPLADKVGDNPSYASISRQGILAFDLVILDCNLAGASLVFKDGMLLPSSDDGNLINHLFLIHLDSDVLCYYKHIRNQRVNCL